MNEWCCQILPCLTRLPFVPNMDAACQLVWMLQEQRCIFSHVPRYTAKHRAHGMGMGMETGMTHSGSVMPLSTLLEVKTTTVHFGCQEPQGQGKIDKIYPLFDSEKSRVGGLVHGGGSMFLGKCRL